MDASARNDRLLVGVLGNRNSGKSLTWNLLFRRTVKRGKSDRWLEVRPKAWVQVFLVSGSFEERHEYAGDVLENQDCRIVLCSMQYEPKVSETLDYLIERGFFLYIQWLNPGYRDERTTYFDRLGLTNRILSAQSTLSVRSGKISARARVDEISEFIYGWAIHRGLIVAG